VEHTEERLESDETTGFPMPCRREQRAYFTLFLISLVWFRLEVDLNHFVCQEVLPGGE
jgi:hypothetical protein